MLRLLIVEDEERIRKGIANKIMRLAEDVEIVGEAANGEEGLKKLELLKPDIVVTDIKMPVIDGMHFIEMALEVSPQTRFMIISGYEDFKFAQQAVRLGVCDYLLKPVNNDELKIALDHLRTRIDTEKERLVFLESLKTRAAENAIWKKNKAFLSLIKGEFTESERFVRTIAECGYALTNTKFTAIHIKILDWQKDVLPGGDFSLLKFAVSNIVEETLENAGTAIALDSFDLERNLALLLNHSSEIKFLAAYLQKAIDNVKTHLQVDIFMGVGKTYSEALSFNDSYREAVKSAAQKVVYKDRGIIFHEDYERIRGNDFILETDEKRKLSYLFRTENIEEADIFIKDIFERVKKKKANARSVKALCMEFLLVIMNEIKQKNEFLFKDLFETNIEEYFSECIFLEDFQSKIYEIIERLSMFLTQDNMASGKKIVGDIKTMLDNDYYKDLKLTQIATKYYINPSYLSTLFLQETGKNFSQYLTDIRISKAKEFLTTTRLSSERIAEYVGYNDRSYFISVFKKSVGLSPSAYREENKRLS